MYLLFCKTCFGFIIHLQLFNTESLEHINVHTFNKRTKYVIKMKVVRGLAKLQSAESVHLKQAFSYLICVGCNSVYFGETSRHFPTRRREILFIAKTPTFLSILRVLINAEMLAMIVFHNFRLIKLPLLT